MIAVFKGLGPGIQLARVQIFFSSTFYEFKPVPKAFSTGNII